MSNERLNGFHAFMAGATLLVLACCAVGGVYLLVKGVVWVVGRLV